MARKYNLFNFLEKKMEVSEISPVTAGILNQLVFKELALFIGISYIANTLSKCEFKVYDEGKEVKDKLYWILNISPNPNQSSSQFINKFVEEYYYHGHSLVVQNGENLHCADSFDIDDTNPLKENTFFNVTFNCHQIKKKHKASEVFYFKLDNQPVKSLIDSLYMQYGEVISQALKAYKQSNGTKYKMIIDNYKAGDATFNKIYNEVLKEQLKTFVDNDNAVYPQFKGIDLQEFKSANTKDSGDIIAIRKEIFEVVAQALKIPLPMMYGNITNMNEIVKVYLSYCIDPLADMISEEITRKYFTFEEWQKGSKVVIDTSCINHVDLLEVAQAIYNAIGSGAVNIDDIRTRLGMEELDTPFSKQYWLSKNFVPAEDMMNGSDNSVKGGEMG